MILFFSKALKLRLRTNQANKNNAIFWRCFFEDGKTQAQEEERLVLTPQNSLSSSKTTSISPKSGRNGTKIKIIGEDFNPTNTVFTTYQTFYNVPSEDGKTIELDLKLDVLDAKSEAFANYVLPSIREAVENSKAGLVSEELKVPEKVINSINFDRINFRVLKSGQKLPVTIWVNGSSGFQFILEG